jgi:amidase
MTYSPFSVHAQLPELSATEAIAHFEARTLSPVELIRAVIERAEKAEPAINAFAETLFEPALEQAHEAERRYARGEARPLEGVPLAVKDEAAIAGHRTTNGSLLRRDHVDAKSSPCIERLLDAGAIAAALAAGTTTLATGSDIAGSIRIPAACCGVVGFKPPYGRVPQDPPYNLDSYCHEGPLARRVLDCARMQNVLAGPHPNDIASLRPKLEVPAELGDLRGWRIAYSIDLGYFEVDAEVVRATEAALDVFRGLGCQVEEIALPWTDAIRISAWTHLKHLFGTDVARNLEAGGELMTPYARAFAEEASGSTADAFLDATTVAGEMYQPLATALERCNVFVCPTNALAAVPADLDPTSTELRINGTSVDPVLGWVMTYPFNMLSRCPVMSVPSGRAETGVPTGIQIVGRSFDDVSVFRAAEAYEKAVGGFVMPSLEQSSLE